MFMVLCLRWGRQGTRRAEDEGAAERAEWLLEMFLLRFLQCGDFPVCLAGGTDSIIVSGGKVDLRTFATIGPLQKVLVKRCSLAASDDCSSVVAMAHLMRVLHGALMRPSREKVLVPEVCQFALYHLLFAIADQIDLSTTEVFWDEATALSLQPSPRDSRVERVSLAIKEALAQEVADNPRLRSTGQVLAVSAGSTCRSTAVASAARRQCRQSSGRLRSGS